MNNTMEKIELMISQKIDNKISEVANSISSAFTNFGVSFVDSVVSVLLVGILVYLTYQCIRFMFFNGNIKNLANRAQDLSGQSILFTIFAFFLLRIFSTIFMFKVTH